MVVYKGKDDEKVHCISLFNILTASPVHTEQVSLPERKQGQWGGVACEQGDEPRCRVDFRCLTANRKRETEWICNDRLRSGDTM